MKVLSEHGAREIRVPQLGEGLREARIVELLRAPGAPLRRGDSLYVIETDKTTVELEAPFDGTLLEWRVAVGDVVEIDSTVALVAPAGTKVSATSPQAERIIPPRTRAHAHERGLDDHALAVIPSASNKLLPEDIDKYRWVIQGKTIRKVIKWTLIVIVLYFMWLWSSEGFVWFQNQKQRFNGGLLPCQNELLGYLCARKELNN